MPDTVARSKEESDERHPCRYGAGGLPGGRGGGGAFEARLVGEWGPGKAFLRLRTFIPVKDSEYLRYDAIHFHHPGTGKLTYLATSYAGEAEGESTPMLDVKFLRGEIEEERRVETKPPEPHLLAPFSRLVGGRWRMTLEGTAAEHPSGRPEADGSQEHSWGLTHQVLESKITLPGYATTVAWTWWDTKTERFRFLGFYGPGGPRIVLDGAWSVEGDTLELDYGRYPENWEKRLGPHEGNGLTLRFEGKSELTWETQVPGYAGPAGKRGKAVRIAKDE